MAGPEVSQFFSHLSLTLREKNPYSGFFWSVFSPNAGKYGKIRVTKTPNTNTLHAVLLSYKLDSYKNVLL